MDTSKATNDFTAAVSGVEADEALHRLVKAAGMATAHTGLQR